MSPPPEVSVVLPTRDRCAFLRDAVTSVLSQEDVELELIVVDDGSTDETEALLAGIADPRLRTLHNGTPRGPTTARNQAIDVAAGTWIAPLDDDDLWAPRKLRIQLDAALAADADWAYCAAIQLDARRAPIDMALAPSPEGLREALTAANVVPGGSSNVIVRTERVRAVGGFDPELPLLGDWDLWVRLLDAPAAACAPALVGYTQHDGNIQRVRAAELPSEGARLIAKHHELWTDAGTAAPVLRYVHVEMELARGRRLRAGGGLARALIAEPGVATAIALLRVVDERLALTLRRRLARRVVRPEAGWLDRYRRLPPGIASSRTS